MKQLHSIILLLITFLCFSCDDKNSVEQEGALLVSKTNATLSNATPYVEISITKGSGGYTATSSNEAIAQPLIIDDKLYITGYNIGNAVVTLSDKNHNQISINISINELITRAVPLSDIIFVKVGDTKTISNSDASSQSNTLYYLLDTTSVVQLSGTISNINIKGLKIGVATLYYLKNYWPTKIYNIQVIDHYSFIVSTPSAANQLTTGGESEVYILSGCDNYGLSISDTKIVSAELKAWPVVALDSYANPRIIQLKGLSKGTATLTITNIETAEEKKVSISVK